MHFPFRSIHLNHKKHNTCIFLIGETSQVSISIASQACGGHALEAHMIHNWNRKLDL